MDNVAENLAPGVPSSTDGASSTITNFEAVVYSSSNANAASGSASGSTALATAPVHPVPVAAVETQTPRGFLFRDWCAMRFYVGLALFVGGTVLGATIQGIGLPLWLSTFDSGQGGAYFVLFFAGLVFNLFFWIGSIPFLWNGSITPAMRSWKWHPMLALVGVCDALNGILVVFNSFAGRLSPILGSILGQTQILFTLVLSRLLVKKDYTSRQFIGVAIVVFGVFFAMIPLFEAVHSGTKTIGAHPWYGALYYTLGQLPGAAMNVLIEDVEARFKEEQDRLSRTAISDGTGPAAVSSVLADSVTPFSPSSSAAPQGNQLPPVSTSMDDRKVPLLTASVAGIPVKLGLTHKRMSVMYLQGVESMYQFLFFVLFFWVDLVPTLGTSSNVDQWASKFRGGFHCFFNSDEAGDRCRFNSGLGILFMGGYAMSYLFTGLVTHYASANLVALANALPTLLINLFFFAWPAANEWSGGDPISNETMLYNIGGILFIFVGLLVWNRYRSETENKVRQLDDEERLYGVQLC